MYPRMQRRCRQLVGEGRYVLTTHALEEMAEDDILNEEVERVLLAGRIVEGQVDRSTGERKYIFTGEPDNGDTVAVVVKIGTTGSVIVLTTYREATDEM